MNKKTQLNVFIVEDNAAYAKTLQGFLISRFADIKIRIFPVGETCLLQMHLNPNILIIDYFLNSKYEDAQNGIEIIKNIKAKNLLTNIIVLSAQENYHIVLEAIKQYGCFYVQKGPEAFIKVEELINDLI